MRIPIRIWAGLYGVAFHAVAAALAIYTAVRNRAGIEAGFWWTAIPPFLVAAFVVYALIVGPYLPKRPTTRGAFFYDSAIGMLAEVAVVAGTAILYAFVVSTRVLEQGVGAYLGAVLNMTIFGFLWALGSFFLQVLVVGNAAGLVGWWVMKRVNAKKGAAQA
jgi:hypothetical protein